MRSNFLAEEVQAFLFFGEKILIDKKKFEMTDALLGLHLLLPARPPFFPLINNHNYSLIKGHSASLIDRF